MNPNVENMREAVTCQEFVRRALEGDFTCEPTGDHLAFAIELRGIRAWWDKTTVNKDLRQFVFMKLLQGEAKTREEMCKRYLGSEVAEMCCPDSRWTEVFALFELGHNRCIRCMGDLGPDNPRQLCGKTFCYNTDSLFD